MQPLTRHSSSLLRDWWDCRNEKCSNKVPTQCAVAIQKSSLILWEQIYLRKGGGGWGWVPAVPSCSITDFENRRHCALWLPFPRQNTYNNKVIMIRSAPFADKFHTKKSNWRPKGGNLTPWRVQILVINQQRENYRAKAGGCEEKSFYLPKC